MESAPSLQADSNASEFKSPHCIPVSTSGAIFQMELSDCQQGSHQLLNSLGSLGGPHNNGCWCMETSAASNRKWKWHPPPPPPHNFRNHELEPHMPLYYLWNHSPSLSSPHIRCPISHYLSFAASFSSLFSLLTTSAPYQ